MFQFFDVKILWWSYKMNFECENCFFSKQLIFSTKVLMISFLFQISSRKNFISSCKYYIAINFTPWFNSNLLAVQFISTWDFIFTHFNL